MTSVFLVSQVQPSLITYLEKSFTGSYHLGLKWMWFCVWTCNGSRFFFHRTELCQLARSLQILSIALPSRDQFKMQHRYFCKIWMQSPPASAFYFHNLNLFPDSLISKG